MSDDDLSEPRFDDLDERHDEECEGDGGGMLMCSCGPRQEHRVLTELHTLRAAIPAPITAEDVRAAERAWTESQRSPSSNFRWRFNGGRHAFIAERLNHARDRAPDPGPGRDETTEGNG